MQKTEEFNLHGVFSGRGASDAGRDVIFEQLQFSASLCVLTALLFELWYLPFKFKSDGENKTKLSYKIFNIIFWSHYYPITTNM